MAAIVGGFHYGGSSDQQSNKDNNKYNSYDNSSYESKKENNFSDYFKGMIGGKDDNQPDLNEYLKK
jgi:hypothetical protein